MMMYKSQFHKMTFIFQMTGFVVRGHIYNLNIYLYLCVYSFVCVYVYISVGISLRLQGKLGLLGLLIIHFTQLYTTFLVSVPNSHIFYVEFISFFRSFVHSYCRLEHFLEKERRAEFTYKYMDNLYDVGRKWASPLWKHSSHHWYTYIYIYVYVCMCECVCVCVCVRACVCVSVHNVIFK